MADQIVLDTLFEQTRMKLVFCLKKKNKVKFLVRKVLLCNTVIYMGKGQVHSLLPVEDKPEAAEISEEDEKEDTISCEKDEETTEACDAHHTFEAGPV